MLQRDVPPMAEILDALLEAIVEFDLWRQVDSNCGGDGPVMMAYRVLGKPVPEEILEWVLTSPDSQLPAGDRGGYPWSTNPKAGP